MPEWRHQWLLRGTYGHRQSECPAAGGLPKGGKANGGKGYKGGKGKGGKGLYEMARDSYAQPSGVEDSYGWGRDDGNWGLAELAAEQARGTGTTPVGSPPGAQPMLANGPWQFGVKPFGVLVKNRWEALADEEEEKDEDFPAFMPLPGIVCEKGQ